MSKIKLWYCFWLLTIIFIVSTTSCKKKDTLTPTVSVQTPNNSKILKFLNNASKDSFAITSNTSWTITNSKNNLPSAFYALSLSSGKKDTMVVVNVSNNPYPYNRYDTLFIIAGSSIFDTIFIQQDGVTASGTLLVSFNNLYHVSGKDSIKSADITLLENGILQTYFNQPIDVDNTSFLSNTIPITANTKLVAAVFKNQNGKIRNWWNWNEGFSLPAVIDLNDSKYYFSGGDGTNSTPYIISNPAQMSNLRKSYHENEFIVQDRDIDFSDAIGLVKLNDTSFDFTKNDTLAVFFNNQSGWIPIGIANGGFPFKGNYDGQGFRIKNLYMNRTSTSSSNQVTGLFGVVATNGTPNSGVINHLIIDKSCLFLGTNSVGGLVGNVQGGNITNCANYAIMKGSQFVSGIAGSMNGGKVENSFNKGKIIGQSYVGGIIGGMYDNSTINNCYNNADIKGNWWIGGLSGYGAGNNCTISNSYNAGSMKTIPENTNAIGGLLGGMAKDVSPISFQNCFYLQEGNINGVGGNTVSGITPSTTTQLQGIANTLGDAWKTDDNQNNGFPILNWQ